MFVVSHYKTVNAKGEASLTENDLLVLLRHGMFVVSHYKNGERKKCSFLDGNGSFACEV